MRTCQPEGQQYEEARIVHRHLVAHPSTRTVGLLFKRLLFFLWICVVLRYIKPKPLENKYSTERFFPNFYFFVGEWYRPISVFSIKQGIFQSLYLLNELSKWPQLGLILKSCVCSLKWAQVEVICSIRLGAAVFQSWCYLEKMAKTLTTLRDCIS